MNKLRLLLSILLFLGGSLFFSKGAFAQNYVVNPNQTYSYSKMVNDMKKLKQAYPGLVTFQSIGKSEYGRTIYAVSLGKGDSTVFINGSHHAREWITTNVNINMIDKYANAYIKNQKIDGYDVRKVLDNTTIWFIPMVNPDGVTLQQTGLKSFPKADHAKIIKMNNGSTNFKRWKANGKGVDLNRQYDARWKYLGGGNVPKFKNYKGKSPESAKETKAVLSFVKDIDPEMAISYHSSGQIMFWKYGQTGSQYTRDRTYAKKLNQITGYRLISPSSYTGGGGFSDWFSTALKKPAYTLEVSPYVGETHVPLKYFKKIWNENETIGLYVAQEGAKLYDKQKLAESNALVKKIKTFNSKAKSLQTNYDTRIKKTSDLKVTDAQMKLYNETVQEIKKQEKAIAKLPAKYQKSANAALQITKTYRDRFANYRAAVTVGEHLSKSHKALVQSVKSGKLSESTIQAYNQLEKEITTTKAKIKNMATTRVRTLATEKYINPVQKDALAIENILSRYTLLTQIDEKITKNEQPVTSEEWAELEKLEQAASTNQLFKLAEQFLQQWKEELVAASSVEEPEEEVQPDTPSSEDEEPKTPEEQTAA